MNRPRILATAILAAAIANEAPAQEVQIPTFLGLEMTATIFAIL